MMRSARRRVLFAALFLADASAPSHAQIAIPPLADAPQKIAPGLTVTFPQAKKPTPAARA
jgi:hypothetical protein